SRRRQHTRSKRDWSSDVCSSDLVNAVYANKIASLEGEERQRFIKEKQEEYRDDIDVYRLASEMVVDQIVEPDQLRVELGKRFKAYESKNVEFTKRKHGVLPV